MATTKSTLSAAGKAAAPAAFAAIATLAAPPGGTYRVHVFVALAGAVSITNEADNFQIVAPSDFSISLGVPGAVGQYGPFDFVWTADGINTLSVTAGGSAGTTGTEYSATILAEPLGTGKLVSL
jgi:hypothetical protein